MFFNKNNKLPIVMTAKVVSKFMSKYKILNLAHFVN